MPADLKSVYENQEDIPEGYEELYSEKNGKYEFSGVEGLHTQESIDRLTGSLEAERKDHKETKAKLKVWTDLGVEADKAKEDLARIPDLEAATKETFDEATFNERVDRRVNDVIASKTTPLETQIRTLTSERDAALDDAERLRNEGRSRMIREEVMRVATAAKIVPEAHEDAGMLGERYLEVRESDGAIVTRDGISGISPGIPVVDWFQTMLNQRPFWNAPSTGAGATGSGGKGFQGENPWSKENWNLTEQARLRVNDPKKARAAAVAAGVDVSNW